MAQQNIGIGTAANDGSGDPLRTAFSKCQDNFTELYSQIGGATELSELADVDPALTPADGEILVYSGADSFFESVAFGAANLANANFSDSDLRVQDNGDATKQLAFEVSGIATATTRTVTLPDFNFTPSPITVADTGTVLSFLRSTVYGTTATPQTGNITFNLTGAVLGTWCLVVHNTGAEPTYPAEAKLLNGSQAYANSVDNYIYFFYLDATHILYHIQNEA